MRFSGILWLMSKATIPAAVAMAALASARCTVNTTNGGSCSEDWSVTGCTGSAVGYSCTGADKPEQSNTALSCSAGISTTSGSTAYCCSKSASLTCATDALVSCPAAQIGYSCTGADVPLQSDATLTCGAGVIGADGATAYCCVSSSTGTCAVDGGVVGCTSGSTGYSCTGTEIPSQLDPALTCGAGVAGSDGLTDYCCVAGTASTCAADNTVTGCTGNATGYSCSSTDTPSQADATLTCGAGIAGANGLTDYCCQVTGAATCAVDSSVTGCAGGSVGYSCTGSDPPSASDSNLTCSTGVAGANGLTDYCCEG